MGLQLSDHQPCTERVPLFDHPEGIRPARPMSCGMHANCTCQTQDHLLPMTSGENVRCRKCGCPQFLGNTSTRLRCGAWRSPLSSGLTTRSQKFALVAPHVVRRRKAAWVSFTDGMRGRALLVARLPFQELPHTLRVAEDLHPLLGKRQWRIAGSQMEQ